MLKSLLFFMHGRYVQVSKPGGPFEIVERDVPEPVVSQVRIKVQACGICHGDSITKDGLFPGIQYPRVPGHEVAGVIDIAGKNVARWKPGQRVAVGWHGGHCGHCDSCKRGDFVLCVNAQVPGISYDGGYADYMIAPPEALVHIPDDISTIEAAPMMCAGITTFNALRNSGARPGDVVVILATAPSSKAISSVFGGLAVNGKLIVVGAANEPIEIHPFLLIGRRSIVGWPSGSSIDSQDTLSFAMHSGIRSVNEVFPLEQASEAYDRM